MQDKTREELFKEGIMKLEKELNFKLTASIDVTQEGIFPRLALMDLERPVTNEDLPSGNVEVKEDKVPGVPLMDGSGNGKGLGKGKRNDN